MAVDVGDLVESLQREVNPPGSDLFPDATTPMYEGYLSDAFWELVRAGWITGYTEDEGVITQDIATPTEDLPREMQQLIVIVAGLRIIRLLMLRLDTTFRAVAGPVEYEVQKSANALNAVLDSLQGRYEDIVEDLANANVGASTFYFDAASLRSIGDYPDSTFLGY